MRILSQSILEVQSSNDQIEAKRHSTHEKCHLQELGEKPPPLLTFLSFQSCAPNLTQLSSLKQFKSTFLTLFEASYFGFNVLGHHLLLLANRPSRAVVLVIFLGLL